MKIGYIRVSTQEQNTIRQEELITALGVDQIYSDRMSGKSTNRPELQSVMDFVRQGDTVVESMQCSMISRSIPQLRRHLILILD